MQRFKVTNIRQHHRTMVIFRSNDDARIRIPRFISNQQLHPIRPLNRILGSPRPSQRDLHRMVLQVHRQR